MELMHKGARMNRHDLLQEMESLSGRVADLETRLHSAEQEAQGLRISEARYRQVVEESPNSIIALDAVGRISFWNRGATRITGHEFSGALGKDYSFLILKPEPALFSSKILSRVFQGKSFSHLDLVLQCSDGSVKTMVSRAYPVRDSRENVMECVLASTDVTVLKTREEHLVQERRTLERVVEERTRDLIRINEQLKEEIEQRRSAESAATQSEARYRALFENAGDAIFIVEAEGGRQGRIFLANRLAAEMHGYERDELHGLHMNDLEPPEEAVNLPDRLERIKQGEWVHEEILHRRKDGTLFPVEVSAGLIQIRDRNCIIGIDRDISDRKKAERDLRESEERFRRFADEVSLEGLVIHDRGKIIDANLNFARMYGYEREDLIGMDVPKTFAPLSRDLVKKHIAEGWEGVYEATALRKDGSTFPVEIHARQVPMKGRMSRAAAVRDLSERKQAEDKLKRLSTAVEQAGESIIITNPEGGILYANPALEKISGFSVAEAVGQDLGMIKMGKQDSLFWSDMREAIQQGAIWRGRLTGKKKDGISYEETATVSPIKDENGRVVSYVMVGRDVTSEVLLQRQLLHAQKMEALGTLAGGIAHDFNNLLQVILGYSDLLLVNKLHTDSDRKKIEIVKHAAREGSDLVSRILTFSRKTGSKIRPIDVNDQVRRVEKLLRRTLPRMIQIDLLLGEDLSIIDADPVQIEQVLLNLGVNAQHAMPAGGRLLIQTRDVSLGDEFLRSHVGALPGHYVLLIVSDTGVGMESNVKDRIFEPFFTTKTEGAGTGLGLSMVHGIVTRHGGYITCSSEPGNGTSFKMYFPVSNSNLVSDHAAPRDLSPPGTETILLVEDDDRIREMARQMMKAAGYRVITACTGDEALETYGNRRTEISLVILDLIMPGMGGERCLEQLLRMDPDVKVLVASGHSSESLTLDRGEPGARGFINKPYDAGKMLGAIRKVLDEGYL